MRGMINSWLTMPRLSIMMAPKKIGRSRRWVDTPAESTGISSLFFWMTAMVNIAASSEIASQSRS